MTPSKRFLLIAIAAPVLAVLTALAITWLLRRPPPAADAAPLPAQVATRPALAVTVAAPQTMVLAQTLTANGNIVAWGDNRYGQLNVPSGLVVKLPPGI